MLLNRTLILLSLVAILGGCADAEVPSSNVEPPTSHVEAEPGSEETGLYSKVTLSSEITVDEVPKSDYSEETLLEMLENLEWKEMKSPPKGAPDWKIKALRRDGMGVRSYVYTGSSDGDASCGMSLASRHQV